MFDNENLFIPQGWRCPICKRVYSPTTSLCLYCGNEQYTTNVATLESQKSLKSFKIMRDLTPEEQKEYSKVLDEIYQIKIGNINDIENQEVSE